jgi:hypothetical protein
MVPVALPGFSSQNVYVSFDEVYNMLEYWHNGEVQMLKLKTARGTLYLNMFLMQSPHFDELRRLLWRRIRDDRLHHDLGHALPRYLGNSRGSRA